MVRLRIACASLLLIFAAVLSGLTFAIPAPAVAAITCTSTPKPKSNASRPALHGHLVYQGDGGLYVTDFTTTNVLAFTNEAGAGVTLMYPSNANFSPDGAWIVFYAEDAKGLRNDVYIAARDGSELVSLTGDLDGSTPYEDPWFSPDGTQILFKKLYFPGGGTASSIMTMKIDLPSSGAPSRVGQPTILLDDGHTQFSRPTLSASGKYLTYFTGVMPNEGVYRKNLETGVVTTISATPNVQSYYPQAWDYTATFYTSWLSATNHSDQLFIYAPAIAKSPSHLAFNDENADNSDAAPVDEDYVIFSSDRCSTTSPKTFKLFLGLLGTKEYWSLDVAGINDPSGSLLGANYTPF